MTNIYRDALAIPDLEMLSKQCAIEMASKSPGGSIPYLEGASCEYGFRAGWRSHEAFVAKRSELERIKILEEQLTVAVRALVYYAEDPAYKESSYPGISSNFRSDNAANMALKKIKEIG